MFYQLPTFSLLLAVCVVSIITQTHGGYVAPPVKTCCENAYPSYGRCICKNGYHGDSTHPCVPPCNGKCGKNTYCDLKWFKCFCKPGFKGDPYEGCCYCDNFILHVDKVPCGGDCIANAFCDTLSNKCKCNDTFIGDPKVNCFKPSVCHFVRTQYVVSETAGFVRIQVNRINGIYGTVTVRWVTTSITATLNADYIGASGSITFLTGEATKFIQIKIVNDNIYERNETFAVVLTSITLGHRIGVPCKTVVTIISEDKPCGGYCKKNSHCDIPTQKCVCNTGYYLWHGQCELPCYGECCKYAKCNIQTFKCCCIPGYYGDPTKQCAKPGIFEIERREYTVKESAIEVLIVVKRTGSFFGNVKVTWVAKDITAIHGHDYVNHGGTIFFASGVTSQIIKVKILNDVIYEKREQFSVRLVTISSGGRFGAIVVTTVNIMDDDEPCHGHCSKFHAHCNEFTQKCECDIGFIGNPYECCKKPCDGKCLYNAKCDKDHNVCVCNPPLVGDGVTKCEPPCGGPCPVNSHSHCDKKINKCVCDDHYFGDPFHGGCKCQTDYKG